MADTTVFPATPRCSFSWPDIDEVPPRSWRTPIAALALRHAVRNLPLRIILRSNEVWGAGSAEAPAIMINDPESFFRRVGKSGMIGFGESYMADEWGAADAETLTAALTILADDLDGLIPPILQRLRRFALQTTPVESRDWRQASKENVAAHYDLSNDLFAAFLDPTMTYSAGLFEDASGAEWPDLKAAQHAKIDRLLDKTAVGPGTRLLEIGTGWGALAIRAAQRGAFVTTLTLSEQQAALAAQRADAAGVGARVEIRLQDYRDADGSYDAIVSVEMVEAVGYREWPTYFMALDRLLAPGGKVGIQAITMPNHRMLATRNTQGWIHKYIFPGGLLPSVEAIERTVDAHTDLHVSERLSFGDHYATTLRLWRERFEAGWAGLQKLGFDDTFRRMWLLYLCYTRAGFEAGYLDVHQFILAGNR